MPYSWIPHENDSCVRLRTNKQVCSENTFYAFNSIIFQLPRKTASRICSLTIGRGTKTACRKNARTCVHTYTIVQQLTSQNSRRWRKKTRNEQKDIFCGGLTCYICNNANGLHDVVELPDETGHHLIRPFRLAKQTHWLAWIRTATECVEGGGERAVRFASFSPQRVPKWMFGCFIASMMIIPLNLESKTMRKQ